MKLSIQSLLCIFFRLHALWDEKTETKGIYDWNDKSTKAAGRGIA